MVEVNCVCRHYIHDGHGIDCPCDCHKSLCEKCRHTCKGDGEKIRCRDYSPY